MLWSIFSFSSVFLPYESKCLFSAMSTLEPKKFILFIILMVLYIMEFALFILVFYTNKGVLHFSNTSSFYV